MTDAAHKRTLVVWDVPPAVSGGQRFSLKAGLKCEAECRPVNWPLEVHDQDGQLMASITVADEPWPGTTALFAAEINLEAPAANGKFAWRIVAPAVSEETPGAADESLEHEASEAEFNLRTVPPADCRLTVVAIDREAQQPVSGLKVVVHPYRALTDQSGVAELDLPKGKYRLFVSGKNFFPYRTDAELTEDTTIRAELTVDLGPSDAELWS